MELGGGKKGREGRMWIDEKVIDLGGWGGREDDGLFFILFFYPELREDRISEISITDCT